MSASILRPSTAKSDVLKFLNRESRQLAEHVRRFGPVVATGASSSTSSVDKQANDISLHLPNPFIPRLNPKTKRWADPKYSLRRQAELVKKAKASGLLHLLPPGPKTPLLDPSHPNIQKYNPKYATVAAEAFAAQAVLTERKRRQPVLPPVVADARWYAETQGSNGVEIKPIQWEGKIDMKMKAGADIGIKLYAGKKKMFKLHKFERDQPALEEKRRVALLGMDKRIAAYKNYYKKKRPNPLVPPKATAKSPKLPF